jgi:hypothetical protein
MQLLAAGRRVVSQLQQLLQAGVRIPYLHACQDEGKGCTLQAFQLSCCCVVW